MKSEQKRAVCSVCGGSGQVSFFQGESRFLLTMEECPACFGTGYELSVDEGENMQEESDERNQHGCSKSSGHNHNEH